VRGGKVMAPEGPVQPLPAQAGVGLCGNRHCRAPSARAGGGWVGQIFNVKGGWFPKGMKACWEIIRRS